MTLVLPKISILIAARNEEKNIPFLLKSLQNLSYPTHLLEIKIGNDHSDDRTEAIVRTFLPQMPHLQLYNIEDSIAGLKGKTNVLAQLAKEASGDYLFFTDADIEVPKNWIESMLSLSNNADVLVGTTFVKGKNVFSICQALEWLFVLFFMQKLSKWDIPSTGMGNNMAIRRTVYHAIGGYEKIGFSIVEDYALYREAIDQGYSFSHIFDAQVMTKTMPPEHFFEQRKRWMTGAFQSKTILTFPAILQILLFPILLILSLFSLKWSLIIMIIQILINQTIGFFLLKKIKKFKLFKYLPIYTLYMNIFWFLQFLYFILPNKVVWKNRIYP